MRERPPHARDREPAPADRPGDAGTDAQDRRQGRYDRDRWSRPGDHEKPDRSPGEGRDPESVGPPRRRAAGPKQAR